MTTPARMKTSWAACIAVTAASSRQGAGATATYRLADGARAIRQAGYSLVELMVALAVGLLIVAGLTAVYVNSSMTRNEIEKTSRQNDNGRYAMQVLGDDLRHAGYLGEFNPNQLPVLAAKPDPCATDLAGLRGALRIPVQGYDNSAGTLTCLNDVRPNTDVVVVRRASTCVIGAPDCDAAVAGLPYFQVSGCGSNAELSSGNVASYYALDTDTTKLTLHNKDCIATPPGTLAALRQYRVHIYFVANNDKPGDGIPTLKRAELALVGGALSFNNIVPLVEGIENLQIEYGLDTPTSPTGTPAAYTADPDKYNACVPADCARYWQNVVAAKVYVLARNTLPTGGFNDAKTYTLGLKADGTTPNAVPVAASEAGYKRHVFETVVLLNNVAGRNLP
jgi:type IV pilus assembly protein PilW